MTGSLFIVDTK